MKEIEVFRLVREDVCLELLMSNEDEKGQKNWLTIFIKKSEISCKKQKEPRLRFFLIPLNVEPHKAVISVKPYLNTVCCSLIILLKALLNCKVSARPSEMRVTGR